MFDIEYYPGIICLLFDKLFIVNMEEIIMSYTAFAGTRVIVSGKNIEETIVMCNEFIKGGHNERLAVFDDASGRAIDIDFRGEIDEILARLETHPVLGCKSENDEVPEKTGHAGRPRLGVVAREISLLPRHWEWLNAQKGGASAAIRRLVDEARRKYEHRDRARLASEALYRFMWGMAGNFENFEEATRAFYEKDFDRFLKLISVWPQDVRRYIENLLDRLLPLENAAAEEEKKEQ